MLKSALPISIVFVGMFLDSLELVCKLLKGFKGPTVDFILLYDCIQIILVKEHVCF